MAGIAPEGGIDLSRPWSAFMDVGSGNNIARLERTKPTTVVGAEEGQATYGEESNGVDRFPVSVGVRHDCGCDV
jgi:hypothetical protein